MLMWRHTPEITEEITKNLKLRNFEQIPTTISAIKLKSSTNRNTVIHSKHQENDR